MGDQFALIALPWLVLQLTGSSVALGSMLAIMAVPRAVFMLFAGAVVDRISPRKAMLFSNIARFLFVGILTFLVFTQQINIPALFIFAFLFGISDAFYMPAQNALIPQLVGNSQLQAANSYIQGMAQIATLIGPAIAGIIIGIFSQKITQSHQDLYGIGIAMLIDTITFVVTIITTLMIKIHDLEKQTEKNETILSSIQKALAFSWKQINLRIVLLIVIVLNFFVMGPITVGIPVLAEKTLKEGATAYGIVTAVFGAGGLIGIILAGVLPPIKPKYFGSLVMLSMALMGISLAFMPFSSSTIVVSVLSGIMGVLNGYTNLIAFTWIQKQIPSELMGRVLSLLMFCSFGLIPISSMISGFVLSINLASLFYISGIITAVFSLGILLLPTVRNMGVTTLNANINKTK